MAMMAVGAGARAGGARNSAAGFAAGRPRGGASLQAKYARVPRLIPDARTSALVRLPGSLHRQASGGRKIERIRPAEPALDSCSSMSRPHSQTGREDDKAGQRAQPSRWFELLPIACRAACTRHNRHTRGKPIADSSSGSARDTEKPPGTSGSTLTRTLWEASSAASRCRPAPQARSSRACASLPSLAGDRMRRSPG